MIARNIKLNIQKISLTAIVYACRPITEVLAPETDSTAALRQMERSDVLRLPVVAADGTLVGVIARRLLAERLSGT